jgi:tetratricopeptide (TPR) repeat protein
MGIRQLGVLILVVVGVCTAAWADDDSPTGAGFWLSRAQTDAGTLTNPMEMAGVLTSIATQWLSIGQTDAAATAADSADAAARRIADPSARFSALLALAGFYDRAGNGDKAGADLDAASSAADAISSTDERNAAHDQLAHTRAAAAGLAEARKEIDPLPDPAARTQAYISLAVSYAQGGHRDLYHQAMELALGALASVSDPKQLSSLQAMVSQTQANAGDLDAAAQTAALIAEPIPQGAAYAALATVFTQQGATDAAKDAITHMVAAAGGSPDESRTEIWLRIARARQALGDSAGALAAVDSAARYAERLEPADRADACAAAARIRAQLGDSAGAGDLINQAIDASHSIADPADVPEVLMAIAVAQAQAGKGTDARQSVTEAQDAAARIPADKRHPEGDPPLETYMEVIHAALGAGDFETATIVAGGISDPGLKSQGLMAIAAADVDRNEYQGAEDTAAQEGTAQGQAAVCGLIAANLARTRSPADAETWTEKLPTAADKIAARLAVAQFEEAQGAGK